MNKTSTPEFAQIIHPLSDFPVPASNSLAHCLEDLEKPTAIFMLKEDYAPDNKVQFQGKFKGRWTVKVNSALGIKGDLESPSFDLIDDAQLNGPVGNNTIQLKFKPKKFSAQLDLGVHTLTKKEPTLEDNIGSRTYWNPYLFYESDRSFKNKLFGLGAMLYPCKGSKINARLNLRHSEDKVNWDISKNLSILKQGFFLSSFCNLALENDLTFNDRRLLLGYDKEGINANIGLDFGKGQFKQWDGAITSLSASYDLKEKGVFGAYYETSIGTLPTKAGAESSQGPLEGAQGGSGARLQGNDISGALDDFSIGYRNKLNRDLEVKTKLSLKGLAMAFFNYRIRDGLNIHSTIQTNLVNQNKNGFLNLPFNLGFKIKLES